MKTIEQRISILENITGIKESVELDFDASSTYNFRISFRTWRPSSGFDERAQFNRFVRDYSSGGIWCSQFGFSPQLARLIVQDLLMVVPRYQIVELNDIKGKLASEIFKKMKTNLRYVISIIDNDSLEELYMNPIHNKI